MNDIETQVLRTIGEDVSSPDVFTDSDLGMAQIRDSVNDAVQELCAVSGSYVRTVHVPLLADQQWYRLTMRRDYMGYIIQCWDRDRHTKLSRTDPLTLSLQDPEWMETTGYPMQYMQVGLDYFGVYMRPSASGVVLELKCVCIPIPYSTTTDPVKLRDIFKHAAAHFAIGTGLMNVAGTLHSLSALWVSLLV